MSGTLPNFLIIGAQKAGTTSLYSYLDAHPDVFLPPGKELLYFDRRHHESLDWYAEKFAGATTECAVGEATPNYMYFGEATDRMAKVVPEAKLIAILRNPVSRAYSHYWHERSRAREDLEFVDALEAEPERLASGDYWSLQYHSYIDRGRYLQQLQRVCDLYPRESLLVLLLDDLQNDPREAYGSMCRFLGVDDSFVPESLGTVANGQVAFRSQRLRQIRRVPLIPSAIKRPIFRVLNKFNSQNVTYPPMDPAVRLELIKTFEQDNAQLAQWLGRDLSFWNK